MSFTQRPRTLAIAAVTVMFITAALTLFLLPPGSLDTQHHYWRSTVARHSNGMITPS